MKLLLGAYHSLPLLDMATGFIGLNLRKTYYEFLIVYIIKLTLNNKKNSKNK